MTRHDIDDGMRDGRYHCKGCPCSFKNIRDLTYHMKHDCGRQEPHKCLGCYKIFLQKSNLRRHKIHDCGRKELNKCPVCNITITWKMSINRHFNSSVEMNHDLFVRTVTKNSKLFSALSHKSLETRLWMTRTTQVFSL